MCHYLTIFTEAQLSKWKDVTEDNHYSVLERLTTDTFSLSYMSKAGGGVGY